MKYCILILAFFVSIASVAQSSLYTAKNLPQLLAESQNNTHLKIERLIALEFHQIINDYRIKNGCRPLTWNDTLWLTSRNHNIYMAANQEITHDQRKNKSFFSGSEPQERLNYVQHKNHKLKYSGEIVLMGFVEYPIDNWDGDLDYPDDEEPDFPTDEEYRNSPEFPKEQALYLFEQWKNSGPHNRNMLSKNHQSHGAAFIIIENEKIYGTDLFGSK